MASRRQFLKTTASAGLLGCLGDFGSLLSLNALAAENADVTPDIVQLTPDIEPIVRKIEQTPREQCFGMMVDLLRAGLPYRRFLSALYLAGIRNIDPQPPGFKFHCVFVIHSAHQMSLDAEPQDRLLPLFWALDAFKVSQQQDIELGDFRLRPVQGKLPAPEKAWTEFAEAMDAWDEERADRAIVALVRSRGAHEIIERLWEYGARDYRNIGHKSIFVANTWRTLQTIGWQHAEPALRSLILGLLDFGPTQKLNEYAFEDQSYFSNREQAQQTTGRLPGTWTQRRGEEGFTLELLDVVRDGDFKAASQLAVEAISSGKGTAQAAWDAVHLAGGELMMRQPGIYGIHTVTSVNGLRYAYETAGDDQTRLLMLLQGIGWMSQFRNFMITKGDGLNSTDLVALPAQPIPNSSSEAAEEIFSLVGKEPQTAAAKAMTYAQEHAEPGGFAHRARQLIFRKSTDSHDYKYPAAIFEDYDLVSPNWKPHMLATSVYHLQGSGQPDSPVMTRARDALKTL